LPASAIADDFHTQPKIIDECADEIVSEMTLSGMYDCALRGIGTTVRTGNYATEFKWWLAGAEHGDWKAQGQVAAMYARSDAGGVSYENEKPGLPAKGLVQAYMWLQIAATEFGQYVEQLPPSEYLEDNRAKLKMRDEVGASMNAAQIHKAQQLAHAWLAKHAQMIEAVIKEALSP
jgi:TPR repeat protein